MFNSCQAENLAETRMIKKKINIYAEIKLLLETISDCRGLIESEKKKTR